MFSGCAGSSIDIYRFLSCNDPAALDSYHWEVSLYRPSVLIDRLMLRWVRSRKRVVTVGEYNRICKSLAYRFSGNGGAVFKSVKVSDREKKPVLIIRLGRDLVVGTNCMKRRLHGAFARLERRREYLLKNPRLPPCSICGKKVSESRLAFARVTSSRSSYELCGSQLRAGNFLYKQYGESISKYDTCPSCHASTRKNLSILSDSEMVKFDLKELRKKVKEFA